jgi:hypothetical protein
VLAVLFGSMVAAPSWSELTPEPQSAVAQATVRNANVLVRLDSERRIVSGTNVRFNLHADVLLHPSGLPEDFDDWSVVSVSCRVKGEEIALSTTVDPGKSYARQVRFASNHFPNGPLPVEFRIVIALHQNDPPLPYSHVVDMGTLTIALVGRNEAFVFGTQVLTDGTPDFEGTPSRKSVMQEVATAGDVLASINYEVSPDPLMRIRVGRSELRDAMRYSTVLYASTHGDATGIYDSLGVGSDHLLAFYPPADPSVFAQVMSKGPIPVFDFVFLYACATLASGSGPASAFFGGLPNEGRALFGFEGNVVPWAFRKAYEGQPVRELDLKEGLLANHMQALFHQLQSGSIAAEALEEANKQWKTVWFSLAAQDPRVSLVPLRVRGDGYARLNYVFLDPSDWDTPGSKNIWYIVK